VANEITGRTRLFGIVADPVGHVRTPMVFNARFAARRQDAVLVPFHVAPEGLAAVFDGFRAMRNFGGFIATVPHKAAAVALCDEVSETGRAVGAVNTIRRDPDGRLVGEMLDGLGFVAGLRQEGIEPRGMTTYLAGAGGAANAIAFALAEAGVARLVVANRTRGKAEELVARVREHFPDLDVSVGTADPSGQQLVVNSTSLGLREGDALPLDVGRLSPETVVAEIIMIPEQTRLLREAAARGCRIHLGKHMLDTQIELMARFMGA
jgi:shikimate dehydrogenase